jgi:TetR/AcrR family transcriptional regulator, regulator of cefoperazone and chloramphenicol sensitivity
MKKQRTDGQKTRQRLLVAAGEVFAEKGFWEATNADICEKAGVNTAAVNYHFSSKEELYVEAWKCSFEKSIQKHPPDCGVSPDASVQERLRGRILSFMCRIADPQTYEIDIIHKEMACPTGLLNEVIEESTKPVRRDIESLIKEILGKGASEEQVRFYNMNIMALCFGPLLHIRHSKKGGGMPHPKDFPAELDVEEFADHTTDFILNGMYGIRGEAGKNQEHSKEENSKCSG